MPWVRILRLIQVGTFTTRLIDSNGDPNEDAAVSPYTYDDLQADLRQLEAEVRRWKAELPEHAWMDAFAGMADAVEERAQTAGLTHDAFIAINAMLIRNGLLDPADRIT